MAWFMYQPLNAVFHSFLNKFQRDWVCLCESLKQANKQKCFVWVLLSNNAGFPGASRPTCSASSSPRHKQRQHPPSSTFSILAAGPSASNRQDLHAPFAIPKRLVWAGSHSCRGRHRATSHGLASWLGLPAGTCPSPWWGHHPHLLVPVPLPIFPKPLTTSCRQFNRRAQLCLQTCAADLNFNIILCSDLQGRFLLQ